MTELRKRTGSRFLAVGASVLSGLLLLAACGGDDSKSASPSSAPTESTPAAPAAAPAAPAAAPEAAPAAPEAAAAAPAAPQAPAAAAPAAPAAASAAPRAAAAPKAAAAAAPKAAAAAPKAAAPGAAPANSTAMDAGGKVAAPSTGGEMGDKAASGGGGADSAAADKAAAEHPLPTTPKADGTARTTESPEIGVSPTVVKWGSISFNTYPMSNIITYPEVGAVQMTWDAVNDTGGIYGRKMGNINDCDDAGDSSRSRACYKKLVQEDKIFALTASITWFSGEAGPDIERDKIPYIGDWGFFSREWTHPWMFPSHAAALHEAHAMARWVAEGTKSKTVGLMYTNIPEMNLARKAFHEVADQHGLKVVNELPEEVSSADQSQNVISMRASNPEFIQHVGFPVGFVKFAIDASQQDYWPPKGMMSNHFIIELIGKVLGKYPIEHGISAITTFNIWGEDYQAMIEKYAPNMREKSHHNSQGAWSVGQIFVKCAKEVGPNLTREYIMKCLESRPWDAGRGFDQTLYWRPGSHDTLRKYFVFHIATTDTTMKGGGFQPSDYGFNAPDDFD